MITIEQKGFTPVTCDEPLPCPFCGGSPKLKQLSDDTFYSTETLTADTFWFECGACYTGSGIHSETAQKAAERWNSRYTD